jgi:hypothetical protein
MKRPHALPAAIDGLPYSPNLEFPSRPLAIAERSVDFIDNESGDRLPEQGWAINLMQAYFQIHD